MSNIDRAAQIIHEHLQAHTLTRDAGDPHALARALQDAGGYSCETSRVSPSTRPQNTFWQQQQQQQIDRILGEQ